MSNIPLAHGPQDVSDLIARINNLTNLVNALVAGGGAGTPVTVATTTRALSPSDAGAWLDFTSGGTLTLNDDGSFPISFSVTMRQKSTGVVTVATTRGDVLSLGNKYSTAGQGAVVGLAKIGAGNWGMFGATA